MNPAFKLIPVILLACNLSDSEHSDWPAKIEPADSSINKLSALFTLQDAQNILGEPAYLADSSASYQKNVLTYQCAYKATESETATGKTGAVYVLIEKYDNVSDAKNKYSFIKKSNADHEGVKVIDDLGNEAYFHSDGENFLFIMVRKDVYVVTAKVNKITGKTSLEMFNQTAKQIVANL